MVLKIPETEIAVLKKIAELDEPSFSEFLRVLADSDTSVLVRDYSEQFGKKISLIQASDLKQILRTVMSFFSAMQNHEKSFSEFGADLLETIEQTKPKNFPIEKASFLEARLQKIFTAGKALSLAAKAFDLMTNQDKIFCGLKIMSDVRPVFSEDLISISAAVVIHTLRIAYHHEGKHTEFSVAMNTEDLRSVIEKMERAEKKEKVLRSFVQTSGISYFEDKE